MNKKELKNLKLRVNKALLMIQSILLSDFLLKSVN